MTKPEIIISLPIFFSESLWINLLQYLLFRPHTLCSCIQNMSKSHKCLLNNISMTWPFPIIHEETGFCQLYLQLLQHCSSLGASAWNWLLPGYKCFTMDETQEVLQTFIIYFFFNKIIVELSLEKYLKRTA